MRNVLTDAQWARLEPHLPPLKPATGRPNKDHRLVLEAILWVLRTGAPWRDLPDRFGPWSTAYSRFYRWRERGVWAAVLSALQRDADARGELDWTTHFVDGTVVRAHQHAAGARKGGDDHDEALGRSRGGFSTKVHIRAEGHGRPMVVLVSAGQRHESMYLEPLMEAGAVRRPGRGRPRVRPGRVVGDKGYSYPRVRTYLKRRRIKAVIPLRKDQGEDPDFDKGAYRERNRIERLMNRLKQYRRVATRRYCLSRFISRSILLRSRYAPLSKSGSSP